MMTAMLSAIALAAVLTAHTPVVVHDSRERYALTSVATAPAVIPGRDHDRRPAAYGRIKRTAHGGAWLQYWLFYRRQDQDRGIVRTGRHEGDWEMVQYRLDAQGQPVQAVYAQHSGAERCAWSSVELRGGHPVVYAARGSHASYLRPGVRDRTWPDPNDEADGRGRAVRPRLVPVSASSPRWMRWSGRWGPARARWWVPGEQDSPRGPAFQAQGRWSEPDRWAHDARGCHAGCDEADECDGREKVLGVGGALALLATLALGYRARRRRPQ
jgi:hypothetical protein